MNTQTPLLIYGATAAGIGLLLKHHPHALLVERSAQVGHEFVAAFHPGSHWQQQPHWEPARQLYDEMMVRNLLSLDGRVHLPPVAVVLMNLVKQEKLNFHLMTRIVAVEPLVQGYEVTLQNADGLQKIIAGRIVDTTSDCESCPAYPPLPIYRKLNAMLFCNQADAKVPVLEEGAGEIVQGRFPGELIFKLDLEKDDDWVSARRKMHHYWQNRPAALVPWTLAAIADRFEVHVEKGPHCVAPAWRWLPSCAYENIVAAFDGGYGVEQGGEVLETVAAY